MHQLASDYLLIRCPPLVLLIIWRGAFIRCLFPIEVNGLDAEMEVNGLDVEIEVNGLDVERSPPSFENPLNLRLKFSSRLHSSLL